VTDWEMDWDFPAAIRADLPELSSILAAMDQELEGSNPREWVTKLPPGTKRAFEIRIKFMCKMLLHDRRGKLRYWSPWEYESSVLRTHEACKKQAGGKAVRQCD